MPAIHTNRDLRGTPSHEAFLRDSILVGDVHTRLKELPPASIDCVITSPPYFGARDYGRPDQLGHEPTIDAWVTDLRAVCHELARVLKPTGSLWLNLGDSYARRLDEGAAPKSLLLGPARLALALVRDGWILRNHVVWAKTNPMPSSIRDRLTPTHETVYFFVRARQYYFDLHSIREPLVSAAAPARDPARKVPPSGPGLKHRQINPNRGLTRLKAAGLAGHPGGKNPGDVWSLATAGFRGAHCAVFPEQLVERPLLATCPKRVCIACGAPWAHLGRPRPSTRIQPTCGCSAGWQPGIVLDPFFGSGTVGVVAKKHCRDWLGIELNESYARLAEERIAAARTAHRSDPSPPTT